MPRHVRRVDAGVVAAPSVPVTAAQPGRLDRNDDAPGRRRRVEHIAQLGKLTGKLNSPSSRRWLKHFLDYTPFKLKVSTPEASYGAFLNFYVCGVRFITPDGTTTPWHINDVKRCHVEPETP